MKKWLSVGIVAVCVAVLLVIAPRLRRQGAVGGYHRASAARVVEIDNSLRALADADREAPRDRWDPDYIVSTIGRDPRLLFEWVRDNTAWIPYRGELRGPVGVLMDREGNSFDRALTLATLLDKAGHTVRLVRGELTPKQALAMIPALVVRRVS
jgi:hypothetical protein